MLTIELEIVTGMEWNGRMEVCPAGWAVLDSKCYKVFQSKLSWQEAENFCQLKGGHIASIHSKEENT